MQYILKEGLLEHNNNNNNEIHLFNEEQAGKTPIWAFKLSLTRLMKVCKIYSSSNLQKHI